jgi:L-lysine 6-transaminase
MGERFLAGLRELAKKNPGKLTNVRGRGLFAAFTLPSPEERKRLLGALMEDGMLALKSGSTSIRFRPPLNVASREIDEALAAIERCL